MTAGMREDSDNRNLIEMALEIWSRRKWLMIVGFLSVFGLVAGLVSALPDLYRSSATLIVGQDDVTDSLVENSVSSELELRLGMIRQALLGREQMQEVIEEFDLYPRMRERAPPVSVIERLRQDIEIEQEAYAKPQWRQSATYAVTITYRAWDPDLAARVANAVALRFKAEDERTRSSEVTRASEIIKEQMESARERFLAQDQRVTDFRNEHMGNLPEQLDVNLSKLARLNAELLNNGEQQVRLANRRDETLASAVIGVPSSAASGVVPDRLRLDQLRLQLEQLRGQYTESHPEIIRLEREIQDLSLELSSVPAEESTGDVISSQGQNPAKLDRDMVRLQAEEQRLRSEIAALTARIEGIPRIEQQLNRLTDEYDLAREEYLSLQKRYQDALLAQSLETEQNQEVKIVEVALPPDFPAGPNRSRLFFVGLMLAGGFAAGLVLLAEQLDKTFRSARDLRKFTRIPVLASIRNIQTRRDRWMSWARFGLNATIATAAICLLTFASYQFGKGGQQLVLAISG